VVDLRNGRILGTVWGIKILFNPIRKWLIRETGKVNSIVVMDGSRKTIMGGNWGGGGGRISVRGQKRVKTLSGLGERMIRVGRDNGKMMN